MKPVLRSNTTERYAIAKEEKGDLKGINWSIHRLEKAFPHNRTKNRLMHALEKVSLQYSTVILLIYSPPTTSDHQSGAGLLNFQNSREHSKVPCTPGTIVIKCCNNVCCLELREEERLSKTAPAEVHNKQIKGKS